MEKCDIRIQLMPKEDIPEGMGDIGLHTEVHIDGVDIVERLALMHTLATALELDKLDIMMYANMELRGAYDNETIISDKPMGGVQ